VNPSPPRTPYRERRALPEYLHTTRNLTDKATPALPSRAFFASFMADLVYSKLSVPYLDKRARAAGSFLRPPSAKSSPRHWTVYHATHTHHVSSLPRRSVSRRCWKLFLTCVSVHILPEMASFGTRGGSHVRRHLLN
jgi:hypothetical protein